MSVNKNRPHLIVIPEDYANREIANGFSLARETRQIQILNESRGWSKVVDQFLDAQPGLMRKFKDRYVMLLIDFDESAERRESIRNRIPEDISDRVFIVGTWSEPENLKRAGLGTFEQIGSKAANECGLIDENSIWMHDLLRHNLEDLANLKALAGSFLCE